MRYLIAIVILLGVLGTAGYLSLPRNPYLGLSPERILEQGRLLDQKLVEDSRPKQITKQNIVLIEKQEIERTRTALQSIERVAPQYEEARRLLANLDKHEAEGKKLMEATIAKAIADDVEGRRDYANEMEKTWLKNGMDAHVSTSGSKSTTLVIRYVLVSRPLLFKLMNETPFVENAKKVGFTNIHFTNGYDVQGTYDIAKNKWN